MKEILVQILNFFGLANWVKITTEKPRCTYYFGPFLTEKEARQEQGGYLDDLLDEGARGITVQVRRFKPSELTIFDDLGEENNLPQMITMSGQPSLNL